MKENLQKTMDKETLHWVIQTIHAKGSRNLTSTLLRSGKVMTFIQRLVSGLV